MVWGVPGPARHFRGAEREGLITVRRYMVVHGSERPKERGGKLTNKKKSERVYS